MDSVRFGRALGVGLREAAKAAAKAAEAAAAPSRPSSARPPSGPPREVSEPVRAAVAEPGRQGVRQVDGTARGLKQGGRRFGQAMWGPFARLSGVLWLEVTGVLFGMFVFVAGLEAWRGRADILRRAGPAAGRSHEWLAIGMLVIFGYFTVSSFVRASRRSRRR